jgi:hypothetical protein
MRSVLLLTGKTSGAEAATLLGVARTGTAAVRRSWAIPDAVAPSLAEVVAALD